MKRLRGTLEVSSSSFNPFKQGRILALIVDGSGSTASLTEHSDVFWSTLEFQPVALRKKKKKLVNTFESLIHVFKKPLELAV